MRTRCVCTQFYVSGLVTFIYSEKATKFCEISILLLTTVHAVRWRFRKILWPSQNMNFNRKDHACVCAELQQEGSLRIRILSVTTAVHCTLHIRVVLSKKLNFHFLFLISSLGYKIKGISSKTCFLNIERILEEIV